MSDEIKDAVKGALEAAQAPVAAPVTAPEAKPEAPTIPPHVAANILEFMKRVTTQGDEAYAYVEAKMYLMKFAAPAPTGPGVPFIPSAR